MPYKKNDQVRVQVLDIGQNGEGIGRTADGYTVFLPGAVPGDEVEAHMLKAKKTYGYGKTLRVLTPSADRVTPPCPLAGRCGGCQLQAMSYEAQLRMKEQKVRADLVRIGGFKVCRISEAEAPGHAAVSMLPILGMQTPWRYRNKALFPVSEGKNGEVQFGFYAIHSHRVIPCEDCLLAPAENREILEGVRRWLRRAGVSIYDERTGKGQLRHVLIRRGFATGEVMVCLILQAQQLPHAEALIEALQDVRGLVGITWSANTERTNVVLNGPVQLVWGKAYITDELHCAADASEPLSAAECQGSYLAAADAAAEGQGKHPAAADAAAEDQGKHPAGVDTAAEPTVCVQACRTVTGVRYQVSPASFYQVNPAQTQVLYQTALDFAALTGQETVMDLYCGTGTISLFLARAARRVIGVEIVPAAVRDAEQNAAINHIENASFYVGRAEEVVPQLCAAQGLTADVVVVDPPRKGCEASLLQTILHMAPQRIVYVSCDPATLARDLNILCAGGAYRLEKVQPVDQFPQTVHIETACLLTRTK